MTAARARFRAATALAMSRRRGSWIASAAGCLVWATSAAAQAPIDLMNPEHRRVEVRFEISPDEAPGQLDRHWSVARPAILERSSDHQVIQIRIPAAEIEQQFRSMGRDPVPESFSDFVWTLDRTTGHVLEAAFEGRVRSELALGFLTTRAEVAIRVEMNTRLPAGYKAGREVLGNRMHGFCNALDRSRECTLVTPRPYDASRGYVNAVGFLRASSAVTKIRTFSPLGEVVFTELADKDGTSIVSGPMPHDAVCSGALRGACAPPLRGESS